MAKKREKIPTVVVGDGTKTLIKKRNDILDTSAPPVMLDLYSIDEEKTIEGLLRLNEKVARDNITISFRINKDVLDWTKKVARNLSSKQDKDINYQKLIISTFLEKFPKPEKKKKGEK